jgi:hypothetical protein
MNWAISSFAVRSALTDTCPAFDVARTTVDQPVGVSRSSAEIAIAADQPEIPSTQKQLVANQRVHRRGIRLGVVRY